MKPSDFLMNTDYLTIAQTGKTTLTCTTSARQVAAGDQYIQTFNFSVPAQEGSFSQVMIKKDNGDYRVGQVLSTSLNSGAAVLQVDRTSTTNIKAEFQINNLFGSTTASCPAITYTIKISTFAPPNIA